MGAILLVVFGALVFCAAILAILLIPYLVFSALVVIGAGIVTGISALADYFSGK